MSKIFEKVVKKLIEDHFERLETLTSSQYGFRKSRNTEGAILDFSNQLDGEGEFGELEEDEYDALNDETFGSDATVADDDWENLHRLLAAEEETNRGRDPPRSPRPASATDLESSLSRLLLADDRPNHIVTKEPSTGLPWAAMERALPPHPPPGQPEPPPITRITTVEELERKLLEEQVKPPSQAPPPRHAGHAPVMTQSAPIHGRPAHPYHIPLMPAPPGLPSPMAMRHGGQPPLYGNHGVSPLFGTGPKPPLHPPHMGRLLGRNVMHAPPMPDKGPMFRPMQPHPHLHPDFLMRGQMMMGGMGPMMGGRLPGPPGMYPPPPPMMGPHMRPEYLYHLHDSARGHFPPQLPHPILYPHLTQQPQRHNLNALNWQQRQLLEQSSGSGSVSSKREDRDEYAHLMTTRQRVWLLNIQMMQLCTDEPYLHDYYYTIWKKRHPKAVQQRKNGYHKDKDSFFANNRPNDHQRERRDSERENRVYVPLQFENSLGKISAKSVIAPRQVFDMGDVVSDGQQAQPPSAHKDHRKTKKILLEIERLYLILIEAEEQMRKENNEWEGGDESMESLHTREGLVQRVLTGLLNEERYLSFLCIRKGKTLLIRCLLLVTDWSNPLFTELWGRMLRSFPTVLRRDKEDALLPKLYPYLKAWSAVAPWDSILTVAKSLLGGSRDGRTSSMSAMRASPCPNKPVLSYIMTNKFGISAVTRLLIQGEIVTSSHGEDETTQWRQFVEQLVKAMANLDTNDNAVKPLEPIPHNILTAILDRRCPHLPAPLHTTAIQLLAS